jgi:hypothetical protein
LNTPKNVTELPAPRQPSAVEAAEAFAALAVKVVLNENAELPVLSVLADRKVRPEFRGGDLRQTDACEKLDRAVQGGKI